MSQFDIVKTLGLEAEARQRAEALLALTKQVEGLDFPISLESPILPTLKVSHFSYYEEEELLGLAGLQEYGEVEPYILVHPKARRRGIGRALLNEIKAECRRHGHDHLLLLCDEASASGRAFVAAVGAQYQSAEYHMELNPLAIDRSRPRLEGIQLRPAGAEAIDLLTRLQTASFGDPEEETRHHITQWLQDPTRQYLIGWLDQEPIGVLRLGRYEKNADITAFGVIPSYRGRGYGRQMLRDAIDRLLAEKWPQICIDVATDNQNALGLYQSCGFRVTQNYGFYFLPL
jgi:ribosomal protein S18 acetylase RimI-like enzyme